MGSRVPLARTLCIVAAAAAAGCAGSADRTGVTTTARHAPPYQRLLRTLASDGRSGAVAIVVTPEGTWRGAAGWADFDAGRRADPDDRFAIEGVAKTYVGAVALQLVQERRLSLRDTVQHWLPGLLRRRPAITVRELVNHTSGLPLDTSGGQTLPRRIRQIAATGALHRPVTFVVYTNANYVLLGLVVEKVTGQRLDRVLTARIFRPLHLSSTSYDTERPKRRSAWLGYPEVLGAPVSGDGGIVSTAADVAAFFRALMTGKVVGKKLLSQLGDTVATEFGDFGVGLQTFRIRLPCGEAWGSSSARGYAVDVRVARDGSKAVVVARNDPYVGDGERVAEKLYCS